MIITISGESGSGKTTVGKLLSNLMNYKFISGGYFFREKAKEYNMDLINFSKYAEKHQEIDHEEDTMLLNFIKSNDNIVIESRLSGYLSYKNNINAYKIYLFVSENERINRLKLRDKNIDKSDIIRRGRSELKRYIIFYGINYKDFSYYDLIINTDKYKPEGISEIIIKRLKDKNI